MLSGLTVSLLAYKEEKNLRILIPQIKEVIEKFDIQYEILVVDTAEPMDNTADVCKQFDCRYINQNYPGFGGAFRTAIENAQMDKFLILDSDGSHQPKYIESMYRKFMDGDYDIVIGSRYVKGGVTNDAKSSIVMSKILNTVFRIALGIKAHDISTDFRIYRTEQLKNVSLENQNYDVLQEVLLKLKLNKKDLTIGEVPISFEKRMFGESKRKLIPFIISYIKTLFRLFFLRFPGLKNLILYGLIGCGGAIVELLVFSLMITLLVPEISNIIGAVCGFAFTFCMNTFLNFRKKDKILKRLVSYGAICVIGMLFSTFVIHLAKDAMNLILLKIILMVVVSVTQFILNKKITYKN